MADMFAILNFDEIDAPIGEEAYRYSVLVKTGLDRNKIDEVAQEVNGYLFDHDELLDMAWEDRIDAAIDAIIVRDNLNMERIDYYYLTYAEA